MSLSDLERKDFIVRLTITTGRLLFAPFFKIKTVGLENLPVKSAFILLPKHQRWEDIPLLSIATPRALYYIAKHELFHNPISRWLLSSMGGIPLNRDRPLESRHSLKRMMNLLGEGEGVVVFPEGTYYKNEMGPGHVGLVRMILSRFSPPFIPVGIMYSGKRGRKLVRIHFGNPVYAGPTVDVKEFLDDIMEEIARLAGVTSQ